LQKGPIDGFDLDIITRDQSAAAARSDFEPHPRPKAFPKALKSLADFALVSRFATLFEIPARRIFEWRGNIRRNPGDNHGNTPIEN